MTLSMVDVVTIGESMVLFQPVADGLLQYTPLFSKSMAGAESNLAIGLSRLGIKVRWISRVGTDPFGNFILSTLAGEGIDTSLVIRDETAPTGIYFKEFRGYGDPNIYYYRQASAASKLSPDDVHPEWFEGARHLHVTGITPALGPKTVGAVQEAMKCARELGLSISFDPNLRRKLWREEKAREVLLSLIPLCDIFLPGAEEAEFLLGKQTVQDYGSRFLGMGTKVVALKLGEQGSVGFFDKTMVTVNAYPVDTVFDTVGAGDAFGAGFLSVLLKEQRSFGTINLHKTVKPALERANVMGALATQFKGDWECLPRIEEVAKLTRGEQIVTR